MPSWCSLSFVETLTRPGDGGASCRDLPGLSFVPRCGQLCHRLDLHVAVLQLPLIILFQQHRADQPDDRCLVGEDPDDVGTSLHFLNLVIRPTFPAPC